MSGVSKIVAEKNHRILLELVSQPGNDICADCKGRAPRWASHNLGIFLCVRCASIHRKIGTHITKVKSLTLDQWSKEQVENMKNIGNIKANQMWNPDEIRNPPPTNMEESERDSELEKYIRSKYEFKRFRDKEKMLSQRAAEILGPSQSKASFNSPARSKTAPIRSETTPQPSSSAVSMSQAQPSLSVPSTSQTRSASAGIPTVPSIPASFSSGAPFANQVSTRTSSTNPFPTSVVEVPAHQKASLNNDTFSDLISLQAPSVNTTLPLQFQPTSSFGQQLQAQMSSPIMSSPPTSFAGSNPYANLSATPSGPGPAFPSSFDRSPNFRSASLPVFGQGAPASASPLTMTATGMNPFHQRQQTFGGGNAGFSSPIPVSYAHNPFNAQFLQQQQQQQQQQQMFSQDALSPQIGGVGALQVTPSSFRHTPSPFATATPPGAFQPSPQPTQMPMQVQQMPMQPQQQYSVASNSPYSQQMQQAQQLFQNMQMGGSSNNPFGRQFG